jgi:hypothetical protein
LMFRVSRMLFMRISQIKKAGDSLAGVSREGG